MTVKWNEIKEQFLEALLNGDKNLAVKIAKEIFKQEVAPVTFFEECITPTLVEVGDRFERLDIFLPEMVSAAEIVQHLNDHVIQPMIKSSEGEEIVSKGKVLIATIDGDLHDIGKNMVHLMLKVNGFDVVDLGVDVPVEEIIDKAEQEKVDIIGLSSLLTSCLPYMKDVVEILKARKMRDKYKVIIGGAAPTQEFADEIGADAQGHSAAEAVNICMGLMNNQS